MASLSVRGLTKGFGDNTILREIDLEVLAGGFCVLVGPSGCGKSTLLRCLAGLEEPDAGAIRIGDRDVTALPPRDRDIAMVFQSYALYPHLTVRENLAFGLKLRKAPADDIERRVREASDMLGLDTLLDRTPKQLSGGQRQRVAMGRAIVRRPALFLFDEPLSNLDAALRSQVRVEIRRLHDRLGATSVYVTHDQVEAMTLADVMVVLRGGRVEQAGAPLDVYRRPATRFVGGFLGSPTMAFLAATVGPRGLELVGGGSLPMPTEVRASQGQKIDVGLRAEDLSIAEEGLAGKVEVTEALGSETFVHVETAAGTLIVRAPARIVPRRGDAVFVHVDASSLHLFDGETGKNLRV
jgi:sn-glycerol 3-phosphate transport system ATP-binding protein/multiple sugar transport system ATP-binding protein